MKSWGQWNWSFHSARYASANRPVMLAFLKTLNINCDRYTRLHLVFTRDASRWTGHRQLLDACKTKNPEIAEKELWKHITEELVCLVQETNTQDKRRQAIVWARLRRLL